MTTTTSFGATGRIVAVPELPRPTLRTWERLYVGLALVGDVSAGALAGILAFAVAANRDPWSGALFTAMSMVLPFALAAAIGLAGGYERRFLGIGPEEFRRVSLGALGLAAFVGFFSWATNAELARSYVLVALPTALLLTGAGRFGLRGWLHRQRRRGRFTSRTVVVGSPGSVAELISHLGRARHHGYDVVSTCLTPEAEAGGHLSDEACTDGVLVKLHECVRESRADTVVVLPGTGLESNGLKRVEWALAPTGANIVVAATLPEAAGPRLALRPVDGMPLLHVEQPQFSGLRRLLKNTYDPIAAAVILALMTPFLLAIAVAIKLDSRGPVLFRQERVGRLGEPFRIVKFRTMVVDAEDQRATVAHLNEGHGPLFKARNDPRVTRIGALLRRTSLDELPQLLNVLAGQMSLVGPRPHLPEEIESFGHDFSRRLFVKPGMTGLWQVSGRSDLSFEESVRLDLRYVENWTLAMDIYIAWKTIGVILHRSGAY